MLLSIIVIFLIGFVVLFHVVQGLFSATLSAIFAVIATLVAVGYHESLVALIAPSKFADEAAAITLVGLFAVTYLLLRTLSDIFIKGNVRFAPGFDHVAAGAMGFIAGICGTGVVVLALQTLPMSAESLGHTRYVLDGDRAVTVFVPGKIAKQDLYVYSAMHEASLAEAQPQKLLLPVDDIVLSLVGSQSNGGAVGGAQPLERIHPDYLQELFAQRVGQPVGAKRTYYNYGATPMVDVVGVYRVSQLEEKDGVLSDVRQQKRSVHTEILHPATGQMVLVVRCLFNHEAADDDGIVRLTCAAVRLVTHHDDENRSVYVNNYPLGTVDDAKLLWTNHSDDPIDLDVPPGASAGVDFAFLVDEQDATVGAAKGSGAQVAPGVFLEIKRLARFDLAEKPGDVQSFYAPDSRVAVMRPPLLYADAGLKAPVAATAHPAAQATAPVQPAGLLNVFSVSQSNKLFTPVNVETSESDAAILTRSVQGTLKDRRFQSLDISATDNIALLARGSALISDFWTPPGSKMVLVQAHPTGPDFWAWAGHISAYTITDTNSAIYHPNGAWARLKQGEGWERMVAHYRASSPITVIERDEGNPSDVWLAFVIPTGVHLDRLLYERQLVTSLNLTVAP